MKILFICLTINAQKRFSYTTQLLHHIRVNCIYMYVSRNGIMRKIESRRFFVSPFSRFMLNRLIFCGIACFFIFAHYSFTFIYYTYIYIVEPAWIHLSFANESNISINASSCIYSLLSSSIAQHVYRALHMYVVRGTLLYL